MNCFWHMMEVFLTRTWERTVLEANAKEKLIWMLAFMLVGAWNSGASVGSGRPRIIFWGCERGVQTNFQRVRSRFLSINKYNNCFLRGCPSTYPSLGFALECGSC
ncbi:hypothetical protein HanXRQr2_Chr09g0413491 [Helianthus annuus]|nr:hypothetical protein HanXRQr2_Chr09g0413491 [Helianthus annuus]KAJ0895355.1 hypothetical protein HanPSC8_Chr09g0399591 [Helianthus annuus]